MTGKERDELRKKAYASLDQAISERAMQFYANVCEQPMGVCGNDYCGHCGARMDGEKIFTPEYMQSVFQEAGERLERIKNSSGSLGLSFKQLDYELMDDRFKSNLGKDTTGEKGGESHEDT